MECDDEVFDRRPISRRPGVYWQRPATAVKHSSQLKAGATIWHVYLWETRPEAKRYVIQRIGTLSELEGRTDLGDSIWFTTSPREIGDKWSCHDCSLDGSDYNNNYLFLTEQDALDAIASRTPRRDATP